MLGMLLLAALALPANVLTVDDSGGAQFSTIQSAIDAAAPGDVIEIAAGNYDGFTLSKTLTLLGPATGSKPHVLGQAVIAGPVDADLAGLQLAGLTVSSAQHVSLDDCLVLATNLGQPTALSVSETTVLVASHCEIVGLDNSGGVGAQVAHSHAAFVVCSIEGGYGYSEAGTQGGDGGPALRVVSSSDVLLADCEVIGGAAGFGSIFLNPWYGAAGNGLLSWQSQVIARGSGHALFAAGQQLDPEAFVGYSIAVFSSTLVLSDVAFDPFTTTGGDALVPAAPEPIVDLHGGAPPGSAMSGRVSGVPGQSGLLVAGLAAGTTQVMKLEGPLWLAWPAITIVPFALPASGELAFEVELPAELAPAGTALRLQAVFPQTMSTVEPGKLVVSNPALSIVRF